MVKWRSKKKKLVGACNGQKHPKTNHNKLVKKSSQTMKKKKMSVTKNELGPTEE